MYFNVTLTASSKSPLLSWAMLGLIKYKPLKKVCVLAIQLEILGDKTLFSAVLQWLVHCEQHQMLKHKRPLESKFSLASNKESKVLT